MSNPVVHFEIIGSDPDRLRAYYGELFGWEYSVDAAATTAVSAKGEYGFVTNAGLNGGVAGGEAFAPHTLLYVGVDDVEAALAEAERLGGTRVLGPESADGPLVVGQFRDPEGNLVGVAGPA